MNTIQKTEIIAYNEFRGQLAELKEFNDKAVFDYESKKGNREARSHIAKLRKTKSAVETCRKAEKKASLEYGRKVDSEAKDIMGEIEGMIQVHKAPLEEIERKEKERVESITAEIENIRNFAVAIEGLSADTLRHRLERVEQMVISEEKFNEFFDAAEAESLKAKNILEFSLGARQQYEDEQAELAKLRAEKEERERREAQEAAERAKKEREEAIARQAAENANRDAEQQAQREKAAAERRERELVEAADRAKREKEEAEERAAKAAEQAKEQARLEAEAKAHREQQEKERREKNKQHVNKVNREAKAAMMDAALLTEEKAKLVIMLIAQGQIPRVKIEY